MKHTRIVQVPATAREETSRITCDLCRSDIVTRGYDVHDVTIEYRRGVSYPEGGHGQDIEFDVCATCFETKIISWFKSQGAEPRETEWEH